VSTESELARLGAATVYEASGREGLVDVEFRQVIPRSRACGPARIARCGQGDNLTVHAVMRSLQMKFMRLPKSQVRIGQRLPEHYR